MSREGRRPRNGGPFVHPAQRRSAAGCLAGKMFQATNTSYTRKTPPSIAVPRSVSTTNLAQTVGTFVGTQRVAEHIRTLQTFRLNLGIDTQLSLVIRGDVLH